MADQVQWRGGSRENSDDFTGAPREVTVDTTDWILRVHDGIKPGGHKMMKVNDCLVVETADKCNPEHPSCKVTINGELNVEGDTNLHDTVIDGNLVVNGNFVQDGLTIAVDTSEVVLTNPGIWENPGGGCDLLPDTGNMKSQEDANQYISRALAALENAICSFDAAAIDEIQDIKDDLTKVWAAIAGLEVRVGNLESDMAATIARLDNIEQTLALLETEIEANQNNITENSKAIEALKVLVADLQDQVDDLAASIGNGKITIENNDGVDIGSFTVNQKGDTTITLPAAFSGDYNDLDNKPVIGNGELQIQDSDGNLLIDFTANQTNNDVLTLPKGFSGDYNDLNNKPLIGDGELKIQDSEGVLLTTFTANQIDDDVLTLPKGFSGDYGDLDNKPEINDGNMTLESESGTVYGSFSANEASNITISIPDPFSGDWADVDNKPTEFPPADHTHTLEELTDTGIAGETDGQVLLYDSGQKLWINADVPESGLPESDINNLIGQQKLDEHVDVTVANPKQHDILAWDDRLQLWVAKSPLQPPSAIHVKGVINVGLPAPQNAKAGDLYFHHDPNVAPGPDDTVTAEGTWTGIVGQEIHEGEYIIFSSDNEWHHTGNAATELNELQSDWNQVDPSKADYIHNKPDIEGIVDSQAGDGAINVNAGNGLAASGANATANQKGNTTRTLSVKTGDGITIDGSGNVIIDPAFNLDGNITPPGNGQINVDAGNGLSVSGANATANQTGNTTRTFTVKTGDGLTIDGSGNVSIDPNFNLDGNVTAPNNGVLTIKDSDGKELANFTANQAGNANVTLPKGFSGSYNDLADKPTIGDGAINVNAGEGLEASGNNAKANQTGTTTRTLKAKVKGGLKIDVDGSIIIDPAFNLDSNVNFPVVNNGKLTIKDSAGANVGEFTANQSGATNVTLPKGFSGSYNDLTDVPTEFKPSSHTHSYNDLTDKPTIPTVGNGKLIIKNPDGTTAGQFTANQSGDKTINLPDGFSGSYNDLTDKPTIPTVNNGKLTIKNADGSVNGEFTANQSGNKVINLPAVNNGKMTLKDSDGNKLGEFTANQSGNTDITIPGGGSSDSNYGGYKHVDDSVSLNAYTTGPGWMESRWGNGADRWIDAAVVDGKNKVWVGMRVRNWEAVLGRNIGASINLVVDGAIPSSVGISKYVCNSLDFDEDTNRVYWLEWVSGNEKVIKYVEYDPSDSSLSTTPVVDGNGQYILGRSKDNKITSFELSGTRHIKTAELNEDGDWVALETTDLKRDYDELVAATCQNKYNNNYSLVLIDSETGHYSHVTSEPGGRNLGSTDLGFSGLLYPTLATASLNDAHIITTQTFALILIGTNYWHVPRNPRQTMCDNNPKIGRDEAGNWYYFALSWDHIIPIYLDNWWVECAAIRGNNLITPKSKTGVHSACYLVENLRHAYFATKDIEPTVAQVGLKMHSSVVDTDIVLDRHLSHRQTYYFATKGERNVMDLIPLSSENHSY